MRSLFIVLVLFMTLALACDEPEGFQYKLALLHNTYWVNPKVEETSNTVQHVDLSEPVVFYENGYAEIGNGKQVYWEVYDNKSLLLRDKKQLWVIMELTPDKMRVEKYTFPETRFTVRMVYEARDGS